VEGDRQGETPERLSIARIVAVWLAGGFGGFLLSGIVICNGLFALAEGMWGREVMEAPEGQGPPLYELLRLLCGPLWWLIPAIIATGFTVWYSNEYKRRGQ
jgi:hypothetical protein